jgi:hypothetical protein
VSCAWSTQGCASLVWAVLAAWTLVGDAAAAAPVAQPATLSADTQPVVQRCLQRLRAPEDVGYARIAARCPDLGPALAASQLAPWLPRGWNEARNDLSAAGLLEMVALQRRLLSSPSPAARATPAQLQSVIAELGLQNPQANSLWKRFRSWLRSLFEKQSAAVAPARGFTEWLRDHGFSDDLWSAVQWVTLAALAVLVGRALYQELRDARRSRRRLPLHLQPSSTVATRLPSLAQIAAAPLRQQPGLLLAVIAELLSRRRLLHGAAALTPREVALRALLADATDHAQLAELTSAAEPASYAAAGPSDELLLRAVAAGGALGARLQDGVRA